MKNWRPKVKPVLTPNLWYKPMLKVWRKLWDLPGNYCHSQSGHNWVNWAEFSSYHKWGVNTGYTFALKFFMLISDGLGCVLTIRPQTPLSLSEGSYLCVSWHNKSMAPLSSMGSFDGLNSSRRLHNVEEAERKRKFIYLMHLWHYLHKKSCQFLKVRQFQNGFMK